MRCVLFALAAAVLAATTASAQQTSGNVAGRVLDQQQAAVPGVTVTATNKATSFDRTVTTDEAGVYRLTALPVGTYDIKAEITGFQPVTREIIVEVGANIDVNFDLSVSALAENVQVRADTPLIETTTSSVGGVVETRRIESLPLNGRQFANLAATIPGVMLNMHSDPTKSTQFAPQIAGGNGRNLNYQIDGGDNNDDTVGGLLQLFPLEAIDQFNVLTSRYKAEYGRSNGGVLNIVTKSGTNDLHGSWLTFFRDKGLNARTETERLNDREKGDYRRWQYGGSFGGPIVQGRMYYFGAFERTQQDTFQSVSTSGLFPELDGTFALPYRESLLTTKVNGSLDASNRNYYSVRFGRNTNSQMFGPGAQVARNGWGDSKNTFNSINGNHNLVIGAGALNEFIFQYADFRNHIDPLTQDTRQTFPNGVAVGQNPSTPQTTEQKKWQFRDDFSWYLTGKGGIGHAMKVGVNWIHEPRLFLTFNGGKGVVQYTHQDNTVSGPLSRIVLSDGDSRANVPMDQYAFYVQDDWRIASRVTLNLGLRYDYIDGYQIDQSGNPNFVKVQAAGAAGQLAGIKGLENFGKDPKEDGNNWQPRIGAVWDVRGDGRDVIRGGWGIYNDMGYTNSNVLFPATDAFGAFGPVLEVDNQQGIKNPDGSFYRIGQPLSNLASQNVANPNAFPLVGQFLDPRLETPYTRQASVGWSHELMSNTSITVDYVFNQGRDLNTRPRINTLQNGQRRLAFLNLQPAGPTTRAASSFGKSEYKGLIFGVKRRMTNGIDLTATYTVQSSKSTVGAGADELNQNNLQDATLLYDDPRVFGPTSATDARHSGTIAGVFNIKYGITLAPMFIFRSALPVNIIEGQDLNGNGETNDLPATAFAFDGLNDDGTVRVKELGACETWGCGRGAKRTQFHLRGTKAFQLPGNTRIEAIFEVFNLFNAKNPAGFTAGRLLGTGAANPTFLKPGAYSGDFQQPEQRVGQIGVRFSF